MRGGIRLTSWAVLAFCTATQLVAVEARTADSYASLTQSIQRLAESPQTGQMRVGVRIVALGPQPAVIYERNPAEALKPASNQKILTSAAALALLPADFRFRTVLARRGDDLVVIGSGDPAIGDPELAREAGQQITAVFHRWADAMLAAGIQHVTGDLLFDDSIFEEQWIHPNWAKQFADQMQSWYVAPVGGLNFNDNCVDIVVRPGPSIGSPGVVTVIPNTPYTTVENTSKTAKGGNPVVRRFANGPMVKVTVGGSVSRPGDPRNPLSLTVVDPGLFFASALRTVLASRGIAIDGQTRRERVRLVNNSIPPNLPVIAVNEQPLIDLLWRVNKSSQNLFAEALLKGVAAYAGTGNTPRVGSYETGREVIELFLRKIGISPEGCVIDDGSGLSHSNRVTAAVLADVLVYMDRHPRQKDWLKNLAEPGEEGTLKKRMKELKGKLFAKTGHIDGVSTLSGYVFGPGGRHYAFSILCNDTNRAKTLNAHALQDSICRELAAWNK